MAYKYKEFKYTDNKMNLNINKQQLYKQCLIISFRLLLLKINRIKNQPKIGENS